MPTASPCRAQRAGHPLAHHLAKTVKTLDRKPQLRLDHAGHLVSNLRSSAGHRRGAGPDLRAVGGPLAVSAGCASQGAGPYAEFESFAACDRARPPRRSPMPGLAEAFVAASQQGREAAASVSHSSATSCASCGPAVRIPPQLRRARDALIGRSAAAPWPKSVWRPGAGRRDPPMSSQRFKHLIAPSEIGVPGLG